MAESEDFSVALSVGPAYVPTVLPIVESMGYRLPVYSRNPAAVRYVKWAVSQQKCTSVISSHVRIYNFILC